MVFESIWIKCQVNSTKPLLKLKLLEVWQQTNDFGLLLTSVTDAVDHNYLNAKM